MMCSKSSRRVTFWLGVAGTHMLMQLCISTRLISAYDYRHNRVNVPLSRSKRCMRRWHMPRESATYALRFICSVALGDTQTQQPRIRDVQTRTAISIHSLLDLISHLNPSHPSQNPPSPSRSSTPSYQRSVPSTRAQYLSSHCTYATAGYGL